jgi:PAS domain S-box-containing protein
MKLLLVDDEPTTRALLRATLGLAGHTAIEAGDGLEALERLETETVDAVITDLMMPRLDGFRLCHALRADPRWRSLPVVVHTGTFTAAQDELLARKLGADRFVRKDATTDELLAALAAAVTEAPRAAPADAPVDFATTREYSDRLVAKLEQRNEELERSEGRLRAIIETEPEGVELLSADGRLLEINRAGLEMLHEPTLAAAQRRPALDYLLPEWREPFRAMTRRVMAGAADSLTVEIEAADGRRRWLDTRAAPLRDGKGAVYGVLVILRDITAQRQAEEALRESEQRFRQLAESIGGVFWMTDAARREILYVSPAYEKIWGRPREALLRSPAVWLDALHPEDRERVRAAATPERQITGDYAEEYRIVQPDGSVRWIRDRAYPVRDAGGRVCRIAGIADDITEQRRMENHFLHAQRVESIGTLAAGVAHDLNNILAPILMGAQLLRGRLSGPEDEIVLQMIAGNAQRGADIVRQLLAFSHGLEGEHRRVAPEGVLQEVLKIVRETFPRQLTVEEAVAPDLWPVNADATQLHQVLLNLCLNARDAMPTGGTLRVTAASLRLAEADVHLDARARPGPYTVFTVSDTGCGIPAEIRARIFDPFFTTKGVGKGTGLGLSAVLGIAKSHGGFVKVYSEPGRGSVFRVYLPALPETAADGGSAEPEAVPQGRGELILAVDDEPAIRLVVQASLEKFGYRPLLAADGAEALRLVAERRGEIALVLTDLMMPGIDGLELIRRLHATAPGLRCLAMAGLIDDARQCELAALGVTEIVPKPASAGDLVRAVARQLALAPKNSSPAADGPV